jgi:hypothetical protein
MLVQFVVLQLAGVDSLDYLIIGGTFLYSATGLPNLQSLAGLSHLHTVTEVVYIVSESLRWVLSHSS